MITSHSERSRRNRAFGYASLVTALFLWSNASVAQDLVEIDQLWKARIDIAVEPQINTSRPNFYRMTIAPTHMEDGYYIPSNLPDAWDELEKMLPRRFAADAASTLDQHKCVVENDEFYNLEQALEDFMFHNWLLPMGKKSALAEYFDDVFQVQPMTSEDNEYYYLTTNLIVCGYLIGARAPEYPELSELVLMYRGILGTEFPDLDR